jgi:hypothetical protein
MDGWNTNDNHWWTFGYVKIYLIISVIHALGLGFKGEKMWWTIVHQNSHRIKQESCVCYQVIQLWIPSIVTLEWWWHFIASNFGQVKNVASMGKSKGKCMNDREFKQIEKVVWETSKCILNSLEAENVNLDLKFF